MGNAILSTLLVIGGGISLLALILAIIRLRAYRRRALDLVFLQVLIPKRDSKEDREIVGEEFGSSKDYTKIAGVMTQLFAAMNALYSPRWKARYLFGQNYFVCEYAVINSQVFFYMAVPSSFVDVAEKQISSYYPDAVIEKADAPNIFRENYKISGRYMCLSKKYLLPIRTIHRLETDSLNNIINSFSKIENDEGAAIQIVSRPVKSNWHKKGILLAREMYSGGEKKGFFSHFNPKNWLGNIFHVAVQGVDDKMFANEEERRAQYSTPVMQERVKAIEEKATKYGFDTIIRVVASAETAERADQIRSAVSAAFDQFTSPDLNGFEKTYFHNKKKLVRDYIFRNFSRPFWINLKRWWHTKNWRTIFSTEELGSFFHFPNIRYNSSPCIKWQDFKLTPPPPNMPQDGLLLGINYYRNKETKVRIKMDDRMRHFYIIGKSGTGKSTILEQMIRQDLQNGSGMCLVDPHGDLVEAVLPYIPRERADDVILFDPGDLERPMGLNLLEAEGDDQKEFIAQETLSIFIKLFGEEIMGPRLQHYFRNGVLTLMSDPEEGATLIDLPRLFTDSAYEKLKVEKVKNPTVKAFWEKEMAKTGQREKEEMIPYFSSKFGPFVTNRQIRNIIAQQKSGFDFRKVMDEGKILLVNLSKGKLGDLNAKLLGMIMVSKIQMAAMSRVDMDESERKPFYLYVDEFQNFVTESFTSILSEARKYRLGLVVAHQYISQITKMDSGGKGTHEDTSIRDAVFGNVGTMMCFKIGAQDAETMEKEFQPIFSQQDLINIANYHAYIKLNIDNTTSRGFVMKTIYDRSGKDDDAAEAYRQLSRLKFARDRVFVEREIERRLR
ncbi:type IV secretion system DNA-binding domain-containing protein [Candidatus Peregrinibacteria bacterium]|nr:type IV secretion system DNA-binding domain-containing protein [Candidatus Peregrinibacteria bacterium]